MADNITTQKIQIDGAQASAEIKKVNADLKTAANDMNKTLVDNSKQFVQNETQVKQWGKTAVDEFKKFGQATMANAALGAKAAALSLGNEALKKGARDAVSMTMELSKSHADLQSRLGASTGQMDKWDKAVFQSATKSKASVSALQSTFNDLSDTFNPDDIAKMIDPIGQGVLLGHNDSAATSDYLKKTVGAQGKSLSEGGMDSLSGADLLKRNGRGFGTTESSMSALGSLDANSVKQSGLSMRELAGVIAGASQTGIDSKRALSGISGLLDMNAKGDLQSLAGQLGIGSFNDKSGKFDISKLGSASALKATNLGKDDKTSLEIFKQTSGLAGDQAEAVFNLIRHYDQLGQTVEKTKRDQQSLGESARLAGDNLKDNYQHLQNQIVIGTHDVLKGFATPLNSLMSGHPLDAGHGSSRRACRGCQRGWASPTTCRRSSSRFGRWRDVDQRPSRKIWRRRWCNGRACSQRWIWRRSETSGSYSGICC